MPTYEYACLGCGQHVEVVQSLTDAPLTSCGACGGRLRKVFHPVGVLFKGSGFYTTDSRGGRASGDGSGSREGAASPPAGSASGEAGGPGETPASRAKEKTA